MKKYRCQVRIIDYRQVDVVIEEPTQHFQVKELAAAQAKREFGDVDIVEVLEMQVVEDSAYQSKPANNRLHLTAFGDESAAVIPLQSNLFADEPPATFGGR